MDFNYSALKAEKLDVSELPARFTTVGGAVYAKGTKIQIVGFGNFPNPSDPAKTYVAACGIVNGASSPVGANTLLGIYFNKSGRQVIENGINDKPIKDLMGKTLEVVETKPIKVRTFVEGKATNEERNATIPVFKIVE